MPKPRYEPTAEMRQKVQAWATVHVPHHQIAVLAGISTKTLLRAFKHELAIGKATAIANISNKLYGAAMRGDKASMFFFLKAQAGWREVERKELTGPDGKPLAPMGGGTPKLIVEFTDGTDEAQT